MKDTSVPENILPLLETPEWNKFFEKAVLRCKANFGNSDAWHTKSFRRMMIYTEMSKIYKEEHEEK